MPMTSECSGQTDSNVGDPFVAAITPATPKGPTGLHRALCTASTPSVSELALPVADAALLGAGESMFAYDPRLALDLDGGPLHVED